MKAPRPIRAALQVFLIAVLLSGAFVVGSLRDQANQQENAVTTFEGLLADTCNAATIAELRANDLLGECKLAQEEQLAEKVVEQAPEDTVVDSPQEPSDVVADGGVLPDARAFARQAVADYFRDNPLPDPDYERRIKDAVQQYLRANPPIGLAPTEKALRAVVRTFLIANPPAAGEPGTGVTTATTDGCDVVFTFTDDTTQRVGPLCGADGQPGPPPTEEAIRNAVATYCATNGDCRGPAGPSGVVNATDVCDPPDGEVVVDVSVEYLPAEQTIRLTCETEPGFPGVGSGGP